MKPSGQAPILREDIPALKTVVVKVGSRIVASGDPSSGSDRIRRIAADLAALRQQGIRMILVTSGAIAQGMAAIGLTKRPATIPMKQACASIGQSRLMEMYEAFFRPHRIPTGQVLLTWDDLRDKKRYLNLRNTLFQLLECRALPIINENDSVGIEEIRFGDNDTLGAQIAMLVAADAYVMLTDVNGLYDADPSEAKDARHISLVRHLTGAIHGLASHNRTEISVGGMVTKLRAAEQVTRSGSCAIIGNGYDHGLLGVLGNPDLGTVFLPSAVRLSARDRWIAFVGKPRGCVVVDDGASRAVTEKGRSLLPAGVRRIRGEFSAGDTVEIHDETGRVIARGLANYSSEELTRIAGLRSAEIEKVLGQKPFDEAVHRDNMVVL